MHGGAIQGIGHVRSQKLVYDTHYGTALAMRHVPQQAADDSRHSAEDSGRRSTSPIRPIRSVPRASVSRRVGAAGAVLSALAAAVGDDIIRRTPVQPEMIVTTLANNRVTHDPLTAFI